MLSVPPGAPSPIPPLSHVLYRQVFWQMLLSTQGIPFQMVLTIEYMMGCSGTPRPHHNVMSQGAHCFIWPIISNPSYSSQSSYGLISPSTSPNYLKSSWGNMKQVKRGSPETIPPLPWSNQLISCCNKQGGQQHAAKKSCGGDKDTLLYLLFASPIVKQFTVPENKCLVPHLFLKAPGEHDLMAMN